MNIQEAFNSRDMGLRLSEFMCDCGLDLHSIERTTEPLSGPHTMQTMAAARASMVLLLFALAVLNAASTGTRVTLLHEPGAAYVKRYLERQDASKTSTNHRFAGFTDPRAADGSGAAPPPPPREFQERTVRVRLGSGKRTYKRGREALLRWRMHEGSSWARIVLGKKPKRRNSKRNMVTVAKACLGVAWCINPCQILYERKCAALNFQAPPGVDPSQLRAVRKTRFSRRETPESAQEETGGGGLLLWAGKSPASAPQCAAFLPGAKYKGKQSAVAYATKEGHLIQGEERMRVLWFCGRGGDDSVWFEVYSVSIGAGRVGGVVFPFVQSMQKRFFREQAETMQRIVSHSDT